MDIYLLESVLEISKENLTISDKIVLSLILNYNKLAEHKSIVFGDPKKMAEHLKDSLSYSQVKNSLKKLVDKGYIFRPGRLSKSIQLLDKALELNNYKPKRKSKTKKSGFKNILSKFGFNLAKKAKIYPRRPEFSQESQNLATYKPVLKPISKPVSKPPQRAKMSFDQGTAAEKLSEAIQKHLTRSEEMHLAKEALLEVVRINKSDKITNLAALLDKYLLPELRDKWREKEDMKTKETKLINHPAYKILARVSTFSEKFRLAIVEKYGENPLLMEIIEDVNRKVDINQNAVLWGSYFDDMLQERKKQFYGVLV